MSTDFNRVILKGHLGRDPATREFENGGKATTFTMATSESWRDRAGERQTRTQWHNIVILDEAKAEIAQRYLKKGSGVLVEGQLETRSYDKSGDTHYIAEVVIRPFNGSLSLQDKAPVRPADKPAAAAGREPGGQR